MDQTAQPTADFEIPEKHPDTRQRQRFYKITNLTSYLKSQSPTSHPKYSKLQWITLGSLLLILPALLFGLRNRTFEQIAAMINPTTARIYVDPHTQVSTRDGSFTVAIEQPPQTNITSVQSKLHFDNNYIRITGIQTTPELADLIEITPLEQANEFGAIVINLAAKSNQTGPNQPFPYATITYQVITPYSDIISHLLISPVEVNVYTDTGKPLQIEAISGHILINPTN